MMKSVIFIIFCFAFFACSQQEKNSEENGIKQVKKYSIEQFYQNIEIRGGSFSGDETKLLVTSNETGISNLYALPIDGSTPKQLTNSELESFRGISYFPDDDRFLYSADKGGNEITHIYMVDLGGTVRDLTPWEGARSRFFQWARDKKSFFFMSNKRDPQFLDLYEMDIETFTPELFYLNDKEMEIASISKNKRYIVATREITTSQNNMYIYDMETKELKEISKQGGDAQFRPQFFDLANENLYYLTNEGSDFQYFAKYNLKTGEKEKVWERDWDILYAHDSYNEKYRVIGVNQDARTVVFVSDLATGDKIELPEFEDGSINSVNFSRSEKLIRLTVGSSSSPNNIFVYNFKTKGLIKLTNTLNPEINPDDLVSGRVVRYKSFDGLKIPAIYYQPHSAKPDSKVPALVWVHGGPGGQTRASYFALIQYLVNHDYAILAVNNRGSSGYGKAFLRMDDRKHGDVDLKDCIYGKDFLKSTDVVDPKKIGIIGGSYGGYLTMAALTFAPDEFGVGVNLFGVTNWLRTLKSIPPYWGSYRNALYAEVGDPNSKDSIMLYDASPLFHANNVTKPLMVLQGANDPRVLQAESDEIVEAVRTNNIPVEYVLFEDEGHGFAKKDNEIDGYGKILKFLDKYLKGE